MSDAQRVTDEIDALVDEQLQQESSGYDHNLNQPRCRWCSAQWHGQRRGGCDGSDVQGPLLPPGTTGAGLHLTEFQRQVQEVIRNGHVIPQRFVVGADSAGSPRIGRLPDRRVYRSTTENLGIDSRENQLDPHLDAYQIGRGAPLLRQRYSITCFVCHRSGRLILTASNWYTVRLGPPDVVECAFRDGPPCGHWEVVE